MRCVSPAVVHPWMKVRMTASKATIAAPAQSPSEAASLRANLHRQVELYHQLLQSPLPPLADPQQASEHAEAFFLRRQPLIRELLRLHDEALKSRAWAADATLPSLASEADRLRAELLRQDQHDQAILQKLRDQLGSEISTVQRGSLAKNAYGALGSVNPMGLPLAARQVARFTDQRG